jgi:hypothetical protein
VNYLVIKTFSEELHDTDSALGIFEIILFHTSKDLLKDVIKHKDHEVTMFMLFQSCKQQCYAFHIIKSGRAD